jgi:hypothetical protein
MIVSLAGTQQIVSRAGSGRSGAGVFYAPFAERLHADDRNGQTEMMGASRRIGFAGVCALACALAWSGAAWAGNVSTPAKTVPAATSDRPASERGVVQSVSTSGLVLKRLDGSTVAVAVDERTRVLIDGKPASILDVRPGFVAAVSFRGATGHVALEVDAFSTPPVPVRVESAAGIVRSVSPAELVLFSLGGSTVRVSLAGETRVVLDGKPASVADLRPGFVAVVRPQAPTGNGRGKKPGGARSVFAFAPAGQRGAHLYFGGVVSVSTHAVVLRAGARGTFRVALAAGTLVYVDGKRASIRGVQPGGVAVVRTGSRRELWAFAAA